MDFNVAPYFDDFDDSKNFHRILFKPGSRVQTREVNQLQTIAQDQLSKFGRHIFKHGSIVKGAETFIDLTAKHVKIQSTFGGSAINASLLPGMYIVGANTGKVGLVKEVVAPTSTDPYVVIYSDITPSGSVPAAFSNSETISVYSNYANTSTLVSSVSAATSNTTGSASLFSVNEGVLFVNIKEDDGTELAYFVKVNPARIVVNKYSNTPTATIGFDIVESIVTSAIDASLLDNSFGSPNYAAPGADRYKIALELVARPYEYSDDSRFVFSTRIKNGVVQEAVRVPIYSDIMETLERRTYDESGDYVVRPFRIRLIDTPLDENVVNAKLSAGKAYIRGREIDFVADIDLSLRKARSTESGTGIDVQTYYGNYITVNTPQFSLPRIDTTQVLELHSTVNAAALSNSTILATAIARSFDYNSGANTDTTFDLFLGSITPIGNANVASVRSFVVPSTANNYTTLTIKMDVANSSIVSNSAFIQEPEYEALVFKTPQDWVANVTAVSYDTKRLYRDVQFTNGSATISTLSSNEDFMGAAGNNVPAALARELYQIVAKTANGTFSAGQFIPMDGAGRTVNIPVVSEASLGTATIDVNDATFQGTADVIASIDITADTRKSKTLVTNSFTVTSNTAPLATVSLLKSDIYALKSIYHIGNVAFSNVWSSATTYSSGAVVLGPNTSVIYVANGGSTNVNPVGANSATWNPANNISSLFTLNTGQTDGYYDHGSVKYTGANNLVGNTVIVYDYFTHGGGRGYFDVNSYPVDYEDIPDFTSTRTNRTLRLRDCLDFRPRRTDGNTSLVFDSSQLPIPFTTADINYSYYTQRIDKIILQKNGAFEIRQGLPTLFSPPVPDDDPEGMTLFVLRYPPYTASAADVKIKSIKNNRYTMRDIGKLDQRLSSVEYYTALSSLELEVQAKKIYDINDVEMFKNGFLVDSFAGHSVGDIRNPEYKCSIDFIEKFMRAPYTIENHKFVANTSSTLAVNGEIITLPYTEEVYLDQSLASKTNNVNPYAMVYFRGDLKLTPDNDTWVDTDRRPDVVINEDAANDAWIESNVPWQTEWGAWETLWTGRRLVSSTEFTDASGQLYQRNTYAEETKQVRTGLEVRPETTVETGRKDEVINTSVVPYVRSREILFEAFGLAPLTMHHLIINDVDATAHAAQWNPVTLDYNEYATGLIADRNGYIKGRLMFPNIPNLLQFAIGTLKIILCNNFGNFRRSLSFAEADYHARGTLESRQTTINSVKVPRTTRNTLTEENVTSSDTVVEDIPKNPQDYGGTGDWDGGFETPANSCGPFCFYVGNGNYLDDFAGSAFANVKGTTGNASNQNQNGQAFSSWDDVADQVNTTLGNLGSSGSSSGSEAQSIADRYQEVLGRAPDYDGLVFWSQYEGNLDAAFAAAAAAEIRGGGSTGTTYSGGTVIGRR